MSRESSVGKGCGLGFGFVFGILAAFGLLMALGAYMFTERARQLGHETTKEASPVVEPSSVVQPSAPVDFGKIIRVGDVGVSVTAVEIGKVEGERLEQPGTSQEKHLIVRLRLDNRNQARRYDYESYSETKVLGDNASLRDDLGNEYRMVRFDFFTKVSGQVKQATLYADKPVTDVLVFERPVAKASTLSLTLPTSRFGSKGEVVFRIPVGKISK